MNDNHKEPTLEESIQQVMQTLPPIIRDYVVQEKYTAVAKSLMAKYNLRIDQGGVLERELVLLLMGIEDPTEFTKVLADEARLDQKTIAAIAQDVNEQVFAPLRVAEEQGGMKEVPQSTKPASHFNLENKIPTLARPQQPIPPHVAPLPPRFLTSAAAIKNQAGPRMPQQGGTLGDVVRSILPPSKPLESSTLLEDHEEPHIEMAKAQAPVRTPIQPIVPARPLADFGTDAPENLPGVVLPVEELPQQGIIREPVVLTPSPAPAPAPFKPVAPPPAPPKPVAPAPVTSYATDPYREPIDEPLSEM